MCRKAPPTPVVWACALPPLQCNARRGVVCYHRVIQQNNTACVECGDERAMSRAAIVHKGRLPLLLLAAAVLTRAAMAQTESECTCLQRGSGGGAVAVVGALATNTHLRLVPIRLRATRNTHAKGQMRSFISTLVWQTRP